MFIIFINITNNIYIKKLCILNVNYLCCFLFFFFNDTATTEIYTLSLHDALPITPVPSVIPAPPWPGRRLVRPGRSEEHTSELQSREDLVCRLLLEKKKKEIFGVLIVKKKQITKKKVHIRCIH